MSRRMLRFDYLNGIYGKHRRRVLRKQQLAQREAQRAEQSLATLVEPMEDRIMLVGDLEIVVDPAVTTIHDETAGLQNTPPNLDATIDNNGNDIAVGALPLVFSDRLTALEADPSGAIGAALSGYDGSNDGVDVFTVTGNGFDIDNLALTDSNGDPLDGFDSGLTTTDDGNGIFLYTDATNDNIVVGREGTGTTADPNGNIVLAIYLDEAPDLTSGKFWTVQYEAIAHDVPGDGTTPQGSYDEPLDLTSTLFATASRDLEFDLTNAPSGQNLFIMFGDGDISDPADPTEVGIVATGKNPLDQSANEGTTITAGDTVNTSQGGGDTTFGTNNQMINEGEGIYFTFVTGPEPEYTVPDLTQTEADVEANIQFDNVFGAKAAEFQVVQLQSGKTAVVQISAYSTTANTGADFIDADGLTGNTSVNILSVEVDDFDGGGETDGNIIDNGDGTFTISGIEAGDTIRYFTDGDHNRVLIEHDGDGRGQDSADFDIGGFKLIQADTATADAGITVHWEDDGPAIDIDLSGAEVRTDDRALTGGSGLPNAGTSTDTDTLTTVTTNNPGADGQDSLVYSLGVSAAGVDSGVDDVATGNSIFLYLESGEVVGRVGSDDVTPNAAGDIAFTVSVDADTGEVTLLQSLAIEHGTPDTDAGGPDYYTTDVETLVAETVTLTATLKDGDLDVATDTANIGDKIGFTDDGPQIDIELSGVELLTDDRSLTGGSGLPDAGTDTDTGTLTTVVTANTTAGADGQDSLVYSLGVSAAGVDSGVDDVATGNSIFLYLEGDDVVGRVGTSETVADPAGAEAFRVSVDSSNAEVTLTQSRTIEHGVAEADAGAPDYYTTDVETLIADAVTLTATLTDGDVDKATDTANIGDKIGFTDDGPDVDFSNLVGTITLNPQTGFWSEITGADQPVTLSVAAAGTFDMVTADGVASTGTVVFDGTTGTLTADFDNDPGSPDQDVTFTLTVNLDGTYVFELEEVVLPILRLSTEEGQLPAGGPDPVQTLTFDSTSIVFFAVDADTAEAGGAFGPTYIVPAIELGPDDLTEAELEAGAAPPIGNGTFPFIREEIEMNVSTSGIGVNNNVLQGQDLDTDEPGTINPFVDLRTAFDESFVINPELLATEVKVFISKTAGGFLPPEPDGNLQGTAAKTDYLYYNVYDESGNFTEAILVTSDIVFDEADEDAGGTGEALWSFTVDIDDLALAGDSIDAIQFTMGFGAIKIPKIEIVVEGAVPPNDIFLDFTATLTDADGDSASSDFEIDLFGNDLDAAFDYTLVDADTVPDLEDNDDAFNVVVVSDPETTSYLVQGFVSGSDQLYLLNGSTTSVLETGADYGAGDPLVNDSRITVDGVTVIVEDATLSPTDITEEDTTNGLNFLSDEGASEGEEDGLVLLVG